MKRLAAAIFLFCICACYSVRKVEELQNGGIAPVLSISEDFVPEEIEVDVLVSDTVKVSDAQGREMIIMKAVKDEDGEMVATDVIAPVVVSATFRNVAERHGEVDLCFDVTVPADMVESRWQLRLRPVLGVFSDTLHLAPIFITGQKYRRAQLRGYQRYRRFLDSIVSDTTVFIREGQLEIFLRRNLPQIYALKTDTSYVSDEHFASLYGITEKEAVRHYTNRFLLASNRRRIAGKKKMFARYVKAPLRTDIRLDTVISSDGGDLIYNYVHTMQVPAGLRKAEISLIGSVYEENRKLCTMPRSEPLTFYISSLSSLSESSERYLVKIIERRVQANTACYVEFASGSSQIDSALGNNSGEMGRIAENLEELLGSGRFDIDSIVVQASCSPEGSWGFNTGLSRRRSEAVCSYYSDLRSRDTIHLEFIPREIPENWAGLEKLVERDTILTASQKSEIERICLNPDPDLRERELSQLACYKHLREEIYPRLRIVRFNFYLHRRGMVKDTVHTTVLDTAYMNGVQALRDRDYKRAITLLRQYADINTALAYIALDYNASALAVLDALPSGPKVEYLRALLYARKGKDRDALQCFVRACEMDPGFVHRANLDPEISALKKKYQISYKL
jgi:tetratricopeptide (TPR) repeat protein